MVTRPRSPSSAIRWVAVVFVAIFGATGCASRFDTETLYLAPGFTRASIRGQAVAIAGTGVPAADGGRLDGELAGVAGGMREAGARVRVRGRVRGNDVTPTTRPAADVANFAMILAPTEGGRAAAQALSGDPRATYLLHVRFSESRVYYRYVVPRTGRPERTTGRKVRMRVELLLLPGGTRVWVADGTGNAWRTRTSTIAVPTQTVAGAPAEVHPHGEGDVPRGELALYPEPPPAEQLTRRLMRRMLARVPRAMEIEPN